MSNPPASQAPKDLLCPHCGQQHPASWSHCPNTGKALGVGQALIGRTIADRYRIVRLLGEGGMGAVYLAEHLVLGRSVALKRMHPELAQDSKSVARFQREARSAAATGHENIVDVIDLGFAEDGAPYLVMELLKGESLAQTLHRERQLPARRACYIAGQVLGALEAVHAQEIIHRDLKPDNIFLTRRSGRGDYVKVLDFGVSKMRSADGEVSQLTRTGVMVGTPHYMSPEQARGMRTHDHRVDLYAVGIILYEMLADALPFTGNNYHALLQSILTGKPARLAAHRPDLPDELVMLVHRAIGKDPSERFPDARAFLKALMPFGAVDMGADTRASAPSNSTPPTRAARTSARDAAKQDRGRPSGIAHAPTTGRSRDGASALAATTPSEPPMHKSGARHTGVEAALPRSMAGVARAFSRESNDWVEGPPRPASKRPIRPYEPPPPVGPTPARRAPRSRRGTGRVSLPRIGEDRVAFTGVPRTTPASSTPPSGDVPPSAVHPSVADAPRATPTPTGPRFARRAPSSASNRRAASGPHVRGAFVIAAVEHIRSAHGEAALARIMQVLPGAVRRRVGGVILPVAWLSLSGLESFVACAENLLGAGDGHVAREIGAAVARRDLPTTHMSLLQGLDAPSAIDRIPNLWRTYHSSGHVELKATTAEAYRVILHDLDPDTWLHACMMGGFFQVLLELTGAEAPRATLLASRGRGDGRTEWLLRWR